ncbi:MAG: sn-glycerol-3-phosphate ABC transporter ATP-binding protein UgpC [Fimbriimonadaceae bacterium]|nr:sn-glycerol-3-phosphate ABC transporter ATP-binding protein UgpC [Fimbriimonadaceae bacterium]
MAGVSFKGVTKIFGKDVKAVNNLSLDVRDQEFMVFVGPSGCGKTTALRMVAGLEEATGGDINIGDVRVNDVPPKDRDIAMVFQNYALYPHMSVYENISFGLKIKELKGFLWQVFNAGEAKKIKGSIDARVKEAATMLEIGHLLERKPKELSGGQRQRVALARAIVRKPKVFLMDEPLSNLDAKLRIQTRAELIRLHRSLGITTIYVTHDQVEAMTMGQRIAVMNGGVLQQCDTPEMVYRRPANKFVAGFIGAPPMNFIAGQIKDGHVDLGHLNFVLPAGHPAATMNGKKVSFGIRPESIYVKGHAPFAAAEGNTFTARVDVVELLGHDNTAYLMTGEHKILANIDATVPLHEQQDMEFCIDLDQMHIFDGDSEVAIR